MDKFLVITIDVEPDCTPSWHYSNPLSFNGVTEGVKKRLQPLFNKFDAVPTYLINNVVLEDRLSSDIFNELEGSYELGTHLHSEFIEPEKRFYEYSGKKGEENQCYLTKEIEFEKMKNITRVFRDNFDKNPTSFRAGRFSAGKNTISILKELGYKVDTSVTPHIRWHDKTRLVPIDYTNAFEQPYFIKEGTILKSSSVGKILEVPVSIIDNWRFLKRKPLWLRPYYSNLKDFLKIIYTQSNTYAHSENIVFNMMFHNVEVMPGLSPYSKTENDCKNYLDLIESFLVYCKNNQISCVGLSDLYDIYSKRK